MPSFSMHIRQVFSVHHLPHHMSDCLCRNGGVAIIPSCQFLSKLTARLSTSRQVKNDIDPVTSANETINID